MVFNLANRTWLLAGLLCVVAFSAAAQGGVSSGQASPFAVPGDEGQGQSTANPFSDNANFADEIQAPSSLFSRGRPAATLPPPQIISPDMNRVLQNRKNWALMTPEEILGVATPEQILGVKKPEDLATSSLTPEQRFLRRQDAPSAESNNQNNDPSSSSRWSLTKDPNSPNSSDNSDNSGMLAPQDSTGDSPFANFNRMLNSSSGKSPFDRPKNNGNWIQAPVQTADSVKAMRDQAAEMDRFKRLLDPGEAVSRPMTVLPEYKFDFPASLPAASDNPFAKKRLAPSSYSSSLSPIESPFAKPIGLAPLPGIATEAPKKVEAPPAWAPKPPPWMSQQPNPFAMPQPKL